MAVLIRLNPVVDAGFGAQLTDLWVRVVNAGGTVGFAAPVGPDEVMPVAQAAFARVRARLADLAVGVEYGRPVAMGFLEPGDPPLAMHLGTVTRLMRDPDRAGRGLGAAVLAALEQAARRRGLARVTVTVRDGRGKEQWYVAHGFGVDGRLPDRVRVRGESLAMVHMSKALDDDGLPDRQQDTAVPLQLQRLDPNLPVPTYAHPGDAGLDLYAREHVTLAPGARARVPTGVAVAVPDGHVGLVHPRSGLAARHGVGLLNSPGTIDAGYRGEVQVILVNHDPSEPVEIQRGDRIAQLLVQRVERVRPVEVDHLPETVRGAGGFGSSGR